MHHTPYLKATGTGVYWMLVWWFGGGEVNAGEGRQLVEVDTAETDAAALRQACLFVTWVAGQVPRTGVRQRQGEVREQDWQ